ncbi:type II secretion system F family protein [Thaumasiovibrio subtropicus]|uniref:type II secretion system F family protein n=1 Tax=Thaumasiovibrio subtropicus TaxID=1891207 RepID=UPI000B35CFDE|nr:type II secretion system F family protein [Thaumasiovibrio subtropicus]
MAHFSYRGRSAAGKEVKGEIEANNLDLAVEALMRQGVIPLKVSAKKQASGLNVDVSSLLNRPIALEPLVIFCRQMYSLTKAGVPLLRAIRGLSQSTTHKLLAQTLDKVHYDLTNGRNFSSALRSHPRVFSELFVSMIAVGESTGRLEEALLQLANYFEQEMETRRRIKSAMRYPIFVLSAIFIALVVLNLKVIPQFSSMFSKFGMDLPLPTKILIGMSNFFVNYWYWMIASMIAFALGMRMWIGTTTGRERWDLWRLKVPIVGDIVNRAQLSRFSRSFSLMLKAGVPLNQSIQLSAEALGNRFLENRLIGMKTAIEAGSSMTVTASNSGVFTPLVQQMIAVGEETGQIDELLLEVADFYDREVDYDLKTLTARIEPILLAIVAGMVLLLALGIFLPMWDMLDIARGA